MKLGKLDVAMGVVFAVLVIEVLLVLWHRTTGGVLWIP